MVFKAQNLNTNGGDVILFRHHSADPSNTSIYTPYTFLKTFLTSVRQELAEQLVSGLQTTAVGPQTIAAPVASQARRAR
jgi:hypothetical protein